MQWQKLAKNPGNLRANVRIFRQFRSGPSSFRIRRLLWLAILIILFFYLIFSRFLTFFSNEFDELRLQPTLLYYSEIEKAETDQLLVHKEPAFAWQRFDNHISKNQLYSPKNPSVEQLLSDLADMKIVYAEEFEKGTQLKLIFQLENGAEAVFKPMRFDREHSIANPNHFYFSDFERHNAEIAAYHLDGVLGFYRVPPTVGRIVNITRDIWPYVGKEFKKTIFKSPAGNTCFHGNCKYYCKTGLAFCGNPDTIEGSMQYMIPFKRGVDRHKKSPWRRSYSKFRKADWETDSKYCNGIKQKLFKSRYLLDIMDIHIFDFLQGNQDRHHIDIFRTFHNESFPVVFDNGRAFGLPDLDDFSILAPIRQCCLIRSSTLQRLLDFHSGSRPLSSVFVESSRRDPVFPLIIEPFLEALDRRVGLVLEEIKHCTKMNEFGNVVFDDGH